MTTLQVTPEDREEALDTHMRGHKECDRAFRSRDEHEVEPDPMGGARVICADPAEAADEALKIQGRERRARLGWLAGFTMLSVLPAAQAAPVTIDLSSDPGILGPTHTWTSGAFSVTGTAYGGQLEGLAAGPDDHGVGITGRGDGELTGDDGRFAQFSFSGAETLTAFASSIAPNDEGGWYGSNSPGVLGTLLASFNTEDPVDLTAALSTWSFVGITGLPSEQRPGGNHTVLPAAFEAAVAEVPVSEPSTLALLGLALLTLGALGRRLIRKSEVY